MISGENVISDPYMDTFNSKYCSSLANTTVCREKQFRETLHTILGWR